jgi:radical SAM family RiPP maturation amino acid epimerase
VEERRLLAHTKRLLERMRGDPEFFREVTAEPQAARPLAERYGIAIDPAEVLPLFAPEAVPEGEADKRWPLAELWRDYVAELRPLRGEFRHRGGCRDHNPRFDAWRRRQIRRCDDQLGVTAEVIVHSVLSFELSAGCSVGCWFCGISAERFRGNFAYTPDHSRLWLGMLGAAVELFGPAAQTGFCYWGTDPSDNPDYPRFLEDFHRVSGTLPSTTTAAPVKDAAFTRRILALSETCGAIGNRFSILNLRMLDRVHAEFSAEELLEVEMVLQNPESESARAFAGRARTNRPAIRAEQEARRTMEDTTIACVSGFLVNMVERKVRLVAPVPASERWPLGYRVYDSRRFADAAGFKAAVEDMIDRHMPSAPRAEDRLRFRDDLAYRPTEDGFELTGKSARFALDGPGATRLGELLSRGESSTAQVRERLAADGCGIFGAIGLIQQLFDRGLLDDEPEMPTDGAEVGAMATIAAA